MKKIIEMLQQDLAELHIALSNAKNAEEVDAAEFAISSTRQSLWVALSEAN